MASASLGGQLFVSRRAFGTAWGKFMNVSLLSPYRPNMAMYRSPGRRKIDHEPLFEGTTLFIYIYTIHIHCIHIIISDEIICIVIYIYTYAGTSDLSFRTCLCRIRSSFWYGILSSATGAAWLPSAASAPETCGRGGPVAYGKDAQVTWPDELASGRCWTNGETMSHPKVITLIWKRLVIP